jgi:hypothetical protein
MIRARRAGRWQGGARAASLSLAAMALAAGCSRDLEVGRFLGPGTSGSTTSTTVTTVGSGGTGGTTAGAGGNGGQLFTSTSSGAGGQGGTTSGPGAGGGGSTASSSSGGGGSGGGIVGLGCLPLGAGGPEGVAQGATSLLVAATASAAYWVDQGQNGAPSALYRFPLSPACDGSFTARDLGVRRVGGLVRDGTNLYLALGDPGELWQIPLAGGNPLTLASGPSAFGSVITDSVDVYWAIPDEGRIMKVAVGGGATTEAASGEGAPESLTFEGASFFWTTAVPPAIRSRAKDLASPATTLLVEPARPLGLAISAGVVYWIRPASAPNAHDAALMFAPAGGGSAAPLVPGLAAPSSLLTDGTYAYWTDLVDQTVMVVPHSMPGAPEIFASGQQGPSGIVGAGLELYWVNQGAKQLVRKLRK